MNTIDSTSGSADIAVTSTSSESAGIATAKPSPSESPIDLVIQKAQERIKAEVETNSTVESEPKQAAASDSTSTETESTTQGKADTATSAGETSASTAIAAPANWDKTLAEQFNRLPDDSAKQVVLELYNNLQAGFTKGMQALAEEKRALGDVAQLREQFGKNPRAVLEQLAQQAGVDVWFEKPLPEGEIPDFQTPLDMAKWAAEEAQRNLRKETQAQLSKIEQTRQVESAKMEFTRQLESAAAMFSDFGNYQEGIIAALQSIDGIDPVGAYKLAAFDSVQSAALELPKAKGRIAELEDQVKKLKSATLKPTPSSMAGKISDNKNASPVERALERAQKRIASQPVN